MDDSIQSLQQGVERLLGRCLLKLQRYEHLIKTLVVNQAIAGPPSEAASIVAERAAGIASKTLGNLVRQLVGSYLVTDLAEEPERSDVSKPHCGLHVSTRAVLQMSTEDLQRTEAGIRELVLLRNNLVHHFVERHDLRTMEGCKRAQEALLDAEICIERELEQVRVWVEDMAQGMRVLIEHLQSKEFKDWFVNGIAPDGLVDWYSAGIVRELLKAAGELSSDGWTSVDAAANWITQHCPEQQPSKYGCRRWREVIHMSGRLELRYRDIDGRRTAWYRPKLSSAKTHHA